MSEKQEREITSVYSVSRWFKNETYFCLGFISFNRKKNEPL